MRHVGSYFPNQRSKAEGWENTLDSHQDVKGKKTASRVKKRESRSPRREREEEGFMQG